MALPGWSWSPEVGDPAAGVQPTLHLLLGVANVLQQDLLLNGVEELRQEEGVFCAQQLLLQQVLENIQGSAALFQFSGGDVVLAEKLQALHVSIPQGQVNNQKLLSKVHLPVVI